MPLGIDFSLTFFGIWENTHTSRLLTGALLGSVAVFYVMPGLMDLSFRPLTTALKATARDIHACFARKHRLRSSDYSAPERRI